MSEKASLLQSIPPLESASGDGGKVSLLSRAGRIESKKDMPAKQNVSPLESGGSASERSAGDGSGLAGQTVAAPGTSGEALTISSFQYVIYGSFVLNFILAGFAAIILFKQLSRLVDERFSAGVKALALGSLIVLLHGFFATYLYASYLNDPNRPIPLFPTLSLWIVLGPVVGYATRNLLARQEKPNRRAALFDGAFYAFVFALSAFGISPSVSTNGALLLTITACFLMIMPIARSLTAYKVACARHRELKEFGSQILIYGLLLLPALLPVLAFVHVFGMSDLLTIFLVNFLTIDFVMLATISILLASSNFAEAESVETADHTVQTSKGASTATAAVSSAPAPPAPAPPAPAPQGPAPSTPPAPTPAASSGSSPSDPSKSSKTVSGNPDDPIIQFFNSEGEEDDARNASKPGSNGSSRSRGRETKPQGTPRIQPPRKPGHPGLQPPKKPSSGSEKAAPNAPTKVKAPAKPKKRL
jgi:hypothetical protein